MKSYARKYWAIAPALIALAGCGGGDRLPPTPGASPTAGYGVSVSDTPVRVGDPYTVGGVTYTPSNPSHYDEVGLASYYGDELAGRSTANGEPFNPAGISAAHRTLPLPSYVEVTALETGRTILVRINDRGPFSRDRIIDLSVGAARQLGLADQGGGPVRVRRVDPVEADRALLRSGRSAQERLATSPQLLTALRAQFERGGGVIPQARPSPDAPAQSAAANPAAAAPTAETPASPEFTTEHAGVSWQNPPPIAAPAAPPAPIRTPAPSASSAAGDYYVQLGAFSSVANAQRLAARARGLGNVQIVPAGRVQRVRLGPFANTAAAEGARGRARSAGFADARVLRDPSH